MLSDWHYPDLEPVTREQAHRLKNKSLGVFPGINDILVCLNRWLILDYLHPESWPGFRNEDKEWKILDLKTGEYYGPFHPLDTTGSPRSWVEIDGKGIIRFCWSEQGTAGSSVVVGLASLF